MTKGADCDLPPSSLGQVKSFIQNGVLWAISEEIDPYLQKRNIQALDTDLFARGYHKEDSKVALINYDGLVSLLETHEQSMG